MNRIMLGLGLLALTGGLFAADTAKLPEGARAFTFKVWCYDAGKAALNGKPGILQIARAMRQRPFGEWDVVYYDPKQTDVEKMMALVNKQCPDARALPTLAAELDGAKVHVLNPISTPGSIIQLRIDCAADAKGKVSVAPPADWAGVKLEERPIAGAETVIELQAPVGAAQKAYELPVRVELGGTAREGKVKVELVGEVK